MEVIDKEGWRNMTKEERYKLALKTRRRIKKWVKNNPGQQLNETVKLIYLLAQRTIKLKGKYEEVYDMGGLEFKKEVSVEEYAELMAQKAGNPETQEPSPEE